MERRKFGKRSRDPYPLANPKRQSMAMIILLLVNLVSACINLKNLYANSVEFPTPRQGMATSLIVFCYSVAVTTMPPVLRELSDSCAGCH
jgi:hypothetical protein